MSFKPHCIHVSEFRLLSRPLLFGKRGILWLIMNYKEIIFESLLDLQKPRRSCLKEESKRIAFPKARPEESSDEDAPSKKTQQKKVSMQL